MRFLRVDVRSPGGEPVALDGVVLCEGQRVPVKTGTPVGVPGPGVVVELERPAGRFRVEVSSEDPADPSVLSLAASELLVWLGDPGGRDFGGIPVVAHGPGGTLRGRIGEPFPVWAGTYTLEVGDPVSGVARNTLVTEVAGERTTLELGRLGSLVVRWGEGRGWPVRAFRVEGGLEQAGRTGEPLALWPGRYRVRIDGGPSAEVEVRAGRLTEIDPGVQAGAPLAGQAAEVVTLIRDGLEEARALLSRYAPDPVARAMHRAGTPARVPGGGDARARQRLRGPSVRVRLKGARGYSLTGWPLQLIPASGAGPVIDGRIDVPFPAIPGRYRLRLDELPTSAIELEVGADETLLELPPLGALEVILRDGLAASLRGSAYTVQGPAGTLTGTLGRELPLPAGRYEVVVPTTPPICRTVEIEPGHALVLDLGALGRVDFAPGPDVPWGTPVWVRPDGQEAETDPSDGTIRGQVGQALHLPPADYRVWVGSLEGEGERLELRAGRTRRPTVVGRGFEALAHDDANRDWGAPQSV